MGDLLVGLGFQALFAAFLAIFAGGPVLLYKRSVRRELFAETARRLDLDLAERGRGIAKRSLSGTIDGFAVSVEEYDTGRFRNGLRVVVDSAGRPEGTIPPGLRLGAAPAGDGPGVGDGAFDRAVRLAAGEPAGVALLDRDTREEVLRLVLRHPTARVAEGRVTVDLPRGMGSGEGLVELLREAVDVAQRLVIERAAVLPRLAHLAGTDPVPGVRRRALETLARSFPGSPAAAEALRRALGDGDEGVRAAAAVGLDDALPAVVGEMLDHPREEEAPAAAWAVGFLPARFPASLVRPVVRRAGRESRAPVRAAGLRALAALGDPECEALALEALGEGGEEALTLAAVRVLGAAAGVGAVPRLRERVSRGGPFAFALRRAVEEAVARIQSRLQGAEAGQVSLTAGGGGELSLAGGGAASGRVSLAGASDPGGRAAVPGEEK